MAKSVNYALLKKGGFMRQKQKGYFSLRLQVVGGNLTAENIRTVSEVAEQIDKTLQVKAEDTLSSKPLKVTLDLLVLMSGIRPSQNLEPVRKALQLAKDDDGFINERDAVYELQKTSMPGLFVAGAVTVLLYVANKDDSRSFTTLATGIILVIAGIINRTSCACLLA